jgi:biotin-dependent carboxylase-like uncharacterized protein
MSLKIHRAAYASIQDGGRFGFESIGVGRAGFADARHAELANLLVGNPANAALVEVFAGAFEVEFLHDIDFATAGAACDLRLDGISVQVGARVRALRGQRLALKKVHAGRVLYLALAGGIALTPVLGSCATDLVSEFGGFAGRLLRALDVLSTAPVTALPISRAWLAANLPDQTPLRVLLAHDCPQVVVEHFFQTEWRVSAQSQRSGMRLENANSTDPPMHAPVHDGISRGVVPGVIQLPPNGLPIVLGVDAQTVGGYFVLGVVIAVDLWRIAHAVPGQIARFQAVSIEQAQTLSQARSFERARLELAILAQLMDVPKKPPPTFSSRRSRQV